MRATLLFALLAACSPYSPSLPSTPFLCGSDTPQCPDGFTCQTVGTQQVCVSGNASDLPDGSMGSGACAAFQDDSKIEPNDTLANAYPTPVASQLMTIKYAMLAICPSGDIDNYKVDITTNLQNLQAVVEYDDGGAALQIQILNAGGTPIANSMPVSGQQNQVQAMAANLPPGTFYAQVTGAAAGNENSYKLTLTVTGP